MTTRLKLKLIGLFTTIALAAADGLANANRTRLHFIDYGGSWV